MDKELLIKKVEDINKEVTKIFDIVCDEKEISMYKIQLLNSKLNLLSNSLDETMLTLLNGTSFELKWFMLRQTITIILSIIALIIMFFSLPIGLIIAGISGVSWFKLSREANIKAKEIIKVDEVVNIANEMVPIFDNCYTFLNGRTNYNLENKPEELEDEELRKINLANHHIELVMANNTKDLIPEEIQETMIKLLQDDLQTDERDLEKLLEIAVKKIISEQRQNEQDMSLRRTKNDEGSGL